MLWVEGPLSILFWVVTQALGCTLQVETKVVGFDAEGTRALLRVESWERRDAPGIDLVVVDLNDGAAEQKRFAILAREDRGDAEVRSANWRAAEAELKAMGMVVDASSASLPLGPGDMGPVALPSGKELVFSTGSMGRGDDRVKLLMAGLTKPAERVTDHSVLASWPSMSSANSYHFVTGVYPVPKGNRVLVVEGHACVEPTVHVLHGG